ncbi:MAG: phage holin family protein [Desulfocapsaceae bacterium]|nr:phage holin family protein [Desulfocapsaceae bacterium]
MKGVIFALQQFYHDSKPADVFVGLCIAVFVNIQALFYGVVLSVLLNVISGIWKYAIINKHLVITARGLKRTIEKIGGYGIALATFGILDVLIIQITNQGFIFTISMIVAGMIILYEGKSITDNLKEITGMNLFSLLYDSARNTFKNRIEADQKIKKKHKIKRTITIEEE